MLKICYYFMMFNLLQLENFFEKSKKSIEPSAGL